MNRITDLFQEIRKREALTGVIFAATCWYFHDGYWPQFTARHAPAVIIGYLALAVITALLLAHFRTRHRGKLRDRHCTHCGYDMYHCKNNRCSECGRLR